MKSDDDSTGAKGTPLGDPNLTRVVEPGPIREARSKKGTPVMPTTTEPAMQAIVLPPMPTTTEPEMRAIATDAPPTTVMPRPPPKAEAPVDYSKTAVVQMPSTTLPSMPAVVVDEPFEYEVLSRRTGEYQAVHRTHPAAIAVVVVVTLFFTLLAVNWLTEEDVDGSPGPPASARLKKLFSW